MSAAVVLAFFFYALLGVPIAFALGLAALIGLTMADMSYNVLAEKMMFSVDSFPLMAIPFFMLAGELMVSGGIIARLVQFANSLVGHIRGGLAQGAVVSGIGLASVSGTAVADAAALHSALGRPMGRIYGVPFTNAVIAASANLGPILPPSAAMIIYATLAGPSVSVARLFAAGILPGLLIAVATMCLVYAIARLRNFAVTSDGFSIANVVRQTRRAFLVLLMPVIVIGGIMGGVFTATEGGAIAVAYAFVVGKFVTRALRWRDLPDVLVRAVVTTSVVGALIAFASTVTFLFSIDMLPNRLGDFLAVITTDPTIFLLLIFLTLIVVGMFIEPASAYIMLVPIFAPLALTFGVDPIHFAMVFILTLVVGMLTPPVGTLLFVMCGISGISIWDLVRQLWPFTALQFAVVLVCLFWPDFVLWLPSFFGT